MRLFRICFSILLLTACRAAFGPPLAPSQSTTIDAAELRRADASNVYDAINVLRPAFFTTRGGTSFINEPATPIVVIINRMVRGGVGELRDIQTRSVRTIRRLSAAEVYQMTGQSAPSGGIELVLGP